MTVRPDQAKVLARAERREWKLDGSRIPVWTWGQGPRVLLLHGWGGRSSQMAPLVSPLLEAGFSAVALDGPAHGEASGRQTTVAAFARVTRALAEALGGFRAAVTHSMGGSAVALALAAGLPLDRAVFIAPPTDLERFLSLFFHTIGLRAAHHEKAMWRASRRYGLPRGGLSMAHNLAKVTTPFLVIHDRHDDKASFGDAEALVQALAHGALLPTEGLGHNRILRSPEVIAATLRFLGAAGDPRAQGREDVP